MEQKIGIERFKQLAKVAGIVMMTLLVAETVACLCMGSVKTGKGLVADYEAAKGSMAGLDTELRVIEKSRRENADAVMALASIMTGRPAEVGFEVLEVHGMAEDGSWANLAIRARNDEALQKYMANLAANKAIAGVAITTSQANPDGSKKVVLAIQKGEAQ